MMEKRYDGKKVYVTNNYNNTVSVIDAAKNKVTATMTVGPGPWSFGQFIGPAPSVKPVASFTANKVSGKAPLSVQFTSKTTGNPTDYYRVFEPSTSNDRNSHHIVTAVYTFKKPGTYTISLTVTNGADSTTVKKTKYITVK